MIKYLILTDQVFNLNWLFSIAVLYISDFPISTPEKHTGII